MTGYLISFSVYTMAMIGLIFMALFVFKKFSGRCFSKKSSMLNVEDSMSLSTRKTLYVVNAGDEKFLIAADLDRTSLIAKLDEKNVSNPIIPTRADKSSTLKSYDGVECIKDFTSIIDFQKERTTKGPMMKELARKLKSEV